jgi:hypothetical protein
MEPIMNPSFFFAALSATAVGIFAPIIPVVSAHAQAGVQIGRVPPQKLKGDRDIPKRTDNLRAGEDNRRDARRAPDWSGPPPVWDGHNRIP